MVKEFQCNCWCDCGCAEHCLCTCACGCWCDCWLPNDFDVPDPGLGDVDSLIRHREPLGPIPTCAHKGSLTCQNCNSYWESRKAKLNLELNPDETYPNEILFYERAIFAWKWSIVPILKMKGYRKPPIPDFSLANSLHVSLEIKAPDNATGYI